MSDDMLSEKLKERKEYLKKLEQEYYMVLGAVKELQNLIEVNKEKD